MKKLFELLRVVRESVCWVSVSRSVREVVFNYV